MGTIVSDPSRPAPSPPPAPRARLGRRGFVKVLGVGAGALGAGAVVGWRFFSEQVGWWWRRVDAYARAYDGAWLPLERRLRHHFAYLNLAPDVIPRFVRDHERHNGKLTLRQLGANRALHTTFLMSTDFFRNGADESKLVRYMAYHDPYASPCWTPFPNA